VLIVDDDPIVLEMTRENLERVGYEVHVRAEALGTSRWIADNLPDVVLLDINMPALDGNEIALLLQKRGLAKKIAVVLFSSMSADELEPLVKRTGALGYLRKTSDWNGLVRSFEALVGRS
jgi:CheY-like chemotaxis protein